MIIWPPKPAAGVAVYAFDFSAFLAEGETIAGTPAIDADGVTASAPTVNGALVEVQLSAGTEGTVARVACTIATSEGQTWSDVAVLEIGGEAVSLATAKAAQRIESDDEDEVLAAFLRAAIRHVETVTGKKLTEKIVSQKVDGFPNICLPGCSAGIRLWSGPVSEILTVKYDDTDGVEQTLASFRLIEGENAKLLPAYGESFPATAEGPGTVRLSYVAGYDPTELPPELTQAAILLFGHYNANREAAIATYGSAAAIELPLGVKALIDPYCVPGLA